MATVAAGPEGHGLGAVGCQVVDRSIDTRFTRGVLPGNQVEVVLPDSQRGLKRRQGGWKTDGRKELQMKEKHKAHPIWGRGRKEEG
jgi:hypothetical protein